MGNVCSTEGCGRGGQLRKGMCGRCYGAQWRAQNDWAAYKRGWKQKQKLAGGRARDGYRTDPEWFDWVIVEAAWEGKPTLPRRLTNSERLHLLWLALDKGGFADWQLAELAWRTSDGPAVRVATDLAAQIASGSLTIPGRDWAGRAVGTLPTPQPIEPRRSAPVQLSPRGSASRNGMQGEPAEEFNIVEFVGRVGQAGHLYS